jgi:hypothetical protein
MLGGMALPPEFENELEHWLTERFARERRELLDLVATEFKEMIAEASAELRQEIQREFAILLEKMARLDSAAQGIDSAKMN